MSMMSNSNISSNISQIATAQDDLCLVGHPCAPIGMGEHVRNTFRALRKAGQHPRLHDIYKLEAAGQTEFAGLQSARQDGPAAINLFHVNGNEVEAVWNHLTYHAGWSGYNIVYPLWELPCYPAHWARQLDRFDEIWAPSQFIAHSLQDACAKPVLPMPLSCDIVLTHFLGRRYFRIPETDYVFLFFYDLRSYTARKNPQGVIRAFRTLLQARPYSKVHLVIKVHGVDTNPDEFTALADSLADVRSHLTLIRQPMSGNEVKNLVRCCDCFVSLHRSEGFGFGIAEAMVLGKPVIATAYSGNLDFMAPDVALGVDYTLIPVRAGEYPQHEDQVWADPDETQAAQFMIRLIDTPATGRRLGQRARQHMRDNFSDRHTGLRYLDRLDAIRSTRGI